MNESLLQSIISFAIHFILSALPFIIFGFVLYKKLRKTALIFILYGTSLTLTRFAVENKQHFIQQMRITGMSASEAVLSWQIQLPMILVGVNTLLLIVALASLAVGINRLSQSNGNPGAAI